MIHEGIGSSLPGQKSIFGICELQSLCHSFSDLTPRCPMKRAGQRIDSVKIKLHGRKMNFEGLLHLIKEGSPFVTLDGVLRAHTFMQKSYYPIQIQN